jgi:hypothetical protein
MAAVHALCRMRSPDVQSALLNYTSRLDDEGKLSVLEEAVYISRPQDEMDKLRISVLVAIAKEVQPNIHDDPRANEIAASESKSWPIFNERFTAPLERLQCKSPALVTELQRIRTPIVAWIAKMPWQTQPSEWVATLQEIDKMIEKAK